jgi:rhodanese-related sulfurtransferase
MKPSTRTAVLLFLLILAGCAQKTSRAELVSRIEAGTPPPILDVRSSDEVPSREGEPLVVYCEHGPRAGLARAGLWLASAGEVRFLEGHMTAWKADGLPVESASD